MKKQQVKCLKCGYEWNTRSEMYFVSCPSCGNKVRIKKLGELNDIPK